MTTFWLLRVAKSIQPRREHGPPAFPEPDPGPAGPLAPSPEGHLVPVLQELPGLSRGETEGLGAPPRPLEETPPALLADIFS